MRDRVMRSLAICFLRHAGKTNITAQTETRRETPRRVLEAIGNEVYQDSAAAAARPATLPQKVQSPTAVPLT